MKFRELALGARFRYAGQSSIWIVISKQGTGVIAKYDPVLIKSSCWMGQSICSFCETIHEIDEIEIELVET